MFWSFLTAIVLLIFTVFGFTCGFTFCQYFKIEQRPRIYHSYYNFKKEKEDCVKERNDIHDQDT